MPPSGYRVRQNVGKDTPLHFSRFVPMYRLNNLPKTPVTTLETACKIARGAYHFFMPRQDPKKQAEAFLKLVGDDVAVDVLDRWEAVLTGLESDPTSVASQVDWVAKQPT